MGTLRRTCATAPPRGPLPKLLWADLLLFVLNAFFFHAHILELNTVRRVNAHLVILAVRVFRDILGFLQLCFQERNALVVRKAAAL